MFGGDSGVNIAIKAHDSTKAAFASAQNNFTNLKSKGSALGGSLGNVQNTISALSGKLGMLAGPIGSAAGSLTSLTTSLGPLGVAGLAAVAGAAIVGFGASCVTSFYEFETALANVRKTTGMTKEETTAFGHELSTLARIPIENAHQKLAEISAVAGQLGIQGSANILNFSKTTMEISAAFDMVAADSAKIMAKMTKIYDLPIEQTANLGSAINVLGNTTGAEEAEIMRFSMSLGAAAKQLGFTATESISMGAALIEMKADASAAGTELGSAFTIMGRHLEDVAALLGTSEDSLRAAFGEDPMAVVIAMTEELGKIEDPLERSQAAATIFGQVGAKAINALSGNIEGLKTNLVSSAKGFTENTSLMEEFAAKTDTGAAKTQELGNIIEGMKIGAGEALAPLSGALTDAAIVALDGVSVAFGALNTVISSVMDVGMAFHDAVLAPISDALEPLTGAIDALISKTEPGIDVMQLFSDVMTIIAEVARRVGEAIGNLLSTAIIPFIDKLTSGADAVGGFIDIFSPLTDLVGGGVGAINEFADGIRNSKDPVEALDESVKKLGETQKQLGEQTEAATQLTQHAWEKAVSAFKSGTGSLKSALSAVEKEITAQKDLWLIGGVEAREDIENTIVSLEKEKGSLEILKSTGEEYFKSAIDGNAKIGGATESNTKTMDAFKVVVGETTIEFEGMAAEMLNNVGGFSKMQKSAEELTNVDWSTFSEFKDSLPAIDTGIQDMTDSFSGFATVIENNAPNLERMKTELSEVAEKIQPFATAEFAANAEALTTFSTTIGNVSSAISGLTSLEEANVEGAANFTRNVHSMVSALGCLEAQMNDLTPSFKNVAELGKDAVQTFIDGSGVLERNMDGLLVHTEAATKTFENFAAGVRTPSGVLVGAIGIFDDLGYSLDESRALVKEYSGELGYLARSSDNAAEFTEKLVNAEWFLPLAMHGATEGMRENMDMLNELTDSMKPYFTFMQMLLTLSEFSVISNEKLAAGFGAITTSIHNFSEELVKIDFGATLSKLFIPEYEEGKIISFSGIGAEFLKEIEPFKPKLAEMKATIDDVTSVVTTLATAFDALATIEDSVIMDSTKLHIVFSNIRDGLNNLTSALSAEGGNFAQILSDSLTSLFKAFEPITNLFKDENGDVMAFNSSLGSFKAMLENIIGTMDLLKELSKATLVTETELAAGFDIAEEAVNRLNTAVVKHIGMIRDTATGKITLNMDSENLFKSIKDFADGWKEITEYMGDSFTVFESGISTLKTVVEGIANFAKTFKDLAAVIFPTSDEIKEGFKHISEGVAYITTAIGSPSFSAVATNMQAFKEKWAEVAGTIVEDTKAFASAIAMLTSFVTVSKQLSDAFRNVTPVVVISAEQIKTALAEFPKAIAELTTFLGSDLFKKITADMNAFSKDYAKIVTALSSSSSTFSSAVSTITSFITVSKQLSDTFSKIAPIIVISGEEIEAALAGFPKAINELTKFFTSDTFRVIEDALNGVNTEYKKHKEVLDATLPSFSSAVEAIESLVSKIASLQNALIQLRDTAIMSTRDIDAALKKVPEFLEHFVKALKLNMGSIKRALSDLNAEWSNHAEEMRRVMPAFNDATKQIGDLVNGVLSLSDALTKLSETGTITEAGFDTGFGHLMNTISNFAKSLSRNVSSLMLALRGLEEVYLEHQSTLNPLINNFIAITDNFKMVADNAIDLACAFKSLTEDGDSLQSGFEVLTTFIGKVSKVAETFYTPVAAEKIQDFIRDIGHIVNALIDLEIDLTLEVDRIVAIIGQLAYPAKHSWQWGADFMGEFINGIYSKFDDLRTAMAAAAEIVKDFLGVESPTKLGPLSDLDVWPRNLVHSFSSGIEHELSSINSSFSKLATPAMTLAATGGETRGDITLNITMNIANRSDADASADAIKRMLLERQIM